MSRGTARTTVRGRKLIVEGYPAGWRQAHIAAAMGISRKCVRIWISRCAAGVEDRIVELRDRESKGPHWLGAELGGPVRTVSWVVLRRGAAPAVRLT